MKESPTQKINKNKGSSSRTQLVFGQRNASFEPFKPFTFWDRPRTSSQELSLKLCLFLTSAHSATSHLADICHRTVLCLHEEHRYRTHGERLAGWLTPQVGSRSCAVDEWLRGTHTPQISFLMFLQHSDKRGPLRKRNDLHSWGLKRGNKVAQISFLAVESRRRGFEESAGVSDRSPRLRWHQWPGPLRAGTRKVSCLVPHWNIPECRFVWLKQAQRCSFHVRCEYLEWEDSWSDRGTSHNTLLSRLRVSTPLGVFPLNDFLRVWTQTRPRYSQRRHVSSIIEKVTLLEGEEQESCLDHRILRFRSKTKGICHGFHNGCLTWLSYEDVDTCSRRCSFESDRAHVPPHRGWGVFSVQLQKETWTRRSPLRLGLLPLRSDTCASRHRLGNCSFVLGLQQYSNLVPWDFQKYEID